MNENSKKNLIILLLLIVVALQFFCYIGSCMFSINAFQSTYRLVVLPSDKLFNGWLLSTSCGTIFGAYTFYKIVNYFDLFKVMRIVVIAYILLALWIYSYNFTNAFIYHDMQFLFIHKLIHAFLIPASFMLPSFFLLKNYSEKPHMLSNIILSAGLGTILFYQYLDIVKFAEGWHNVIFYASILGYIFYFFAEKLLSTEIAFEQENIVKLPLLHVLLFIVFGCFSGITFGYHFSFVAPYIREVLISSNCRGLDFVYYYVLVVAIIPIAKFISRKYLFIALKFVTLVIVLFSIILMTSQHITANVYIIEQIIFGILTAVLLTSCQSLITQSLKYANNHRTEIFLFSAFFIIFAIAPCLFLKLLKADTLPLLGLMLIFPVASLFVFTLVKYEKETVNSMK